MDTKLFITGQVWAMPEISKVVPSGEIKIALKRHFRGDWGDLVDQDRNANDNALQNDGQLLSAYVSKSNTRFWIITEADRSQTTVLLPSEY